jgi:riboflavin kinase / FMN adenylyltransferase
VQLGEQRGRTLGFPTANLRPADCGQRSVGVYAAVARTPDGVWWPAAVNVGRRPTFTGGDAAITIEVHVIGFDGDLYGQTLTVHFLERLRDEVRFTSVEQLVEQLRRDVAAAADVVAQVGSVVLPETDQVARSARSVV